MNINVTKTATCKVCGQDYEKGVVITKDTNGTFFKHLRDYTDSGSVLEEFVCDDCLSNLSAKSLIQFIGDDLEIIVDPSFISKVALDIIEEKGWCCNLDVKNALRERGYIAKQGDVREVLRGLCTTMPNLDKVLYTNPMMGFSYYLYYLNDQKESVTLSIGAVDFNMECYTTPVHVFNQFLEYIEVVGEDVIKEMLAIDDITEDSLWEMFHTDNVEFIWNDTSDEEADD